MMTIGAHRAPTHGQESARVDFGFNVRLGEFENWDR
jgi:hypothetical protein